MPLHKIDYSKTVIYKICCKDLTIPYVYVGSTSDFIRRKYQHKTYCTNEASSSYNMRLYETIRNHGGWDNWDMVVVEEYPCESSIQARSRERHWYEQLNCNLNVNIPFRSAEEKKEYQRDYQKTYQKNSERYKEYQREYHKTYQKQDSFKEKRKMYWERIKEDPVKYAALQEKRNADYLRRKSLGDSPKN